MADATYATRIEGGNQRETREILVEEAPLQIRINGRPYTVTMRTPGQDRWLAAGLLFTEGILARAEELLGIHEAKSLEGITHEVDLTVPKDLLESKNVFNRSIASSSSCGLCGKTELNDIEVQESLASVAQLNAVLIPALFEQLQRSQPIFSQTGGSHAAGVFTLLGEPLAVQEDIGRHNAVDKAIGALWLSNAISHAAILCVSGRVSYEIVSKCLRARIPFLLSVSAPSSMAVDMCRQKGIALIGFCRNQRATIYTRAESISMPQLAAL